jgi:hypothetical protein
MALFVGDEKPPFGGKGGDIYASGSISELAGDFVQANECQTML